MTADPRTMNVSACTFTPASGSSMPVTGLKTATRNQNPQELTDGADMDFFDTFGGVISGKPSVTFSSNKPFLLEGVAPGTFGVLVFTLNSFKNAATAGGGGMIYTLSNCYFMPAEASFGHRIFGTSTVTFTGLSVDGTTSPLAATAA